MAASIDKKGYRRSVRLLAFACVLAGGCDESAAPSTPPAGPSGKADDGSAGLEAYEIEHEDHLLEIYEREDRSALDVRVGAWRFVVPWDGQTPRCPCRTYASAVLTLEAETFAHGSEFTVLSARLGLEASVTALPDDPSSGQILLEEGAPTVADYLALLETADDDERALLDEIAEADLEGYLRTLDPAQMIQLYWHDRAALQEVAELLNARVYRPAA